MNPADVAPAALPLVSADVSLIALFLQAHWVAEQVVKWIPGLRQEAHPGMTSGQRRPWSGRLEGEATSRNQPPGAWNPNFPPP